MDADFSVELGAEDETLEIPWSSPEGQVRYHDLKRQPELLLYVEEAAHTRELGEFLCTVNSEASMLQSAKCDSWLSNEISEEEAIYGCSWKFGSYVDLLFAAGGAQAMGSGQQLLFAAHEELAAKLCKLLGRAPQICAAAELIIRCCYYHREESPTAPPQSGFYVTFYLFGYGADQEEARQHWGIALKLVGNAILQLSGARRTQSV